MKAKITLTVVLLMLLLGVSHLTSYELWRESESISVAAASDLQYAFTELGERFENDTGTHVIFKYGSSGLLASEIEGGAPFDVYGSANKAFTLDLVDKDRLIEDSTRLYSNGRIVLATRRNSTFKPVILEDLRDKRIVKIAIANPSHAPYGIAGREALVNSGVWEDVKGKLIYGKNVRDTLELVEMGEADAGIVALSLVVNGADHGVHVDYYPIDMELYNPLEQTMGVVQGTLKEKSARAFIGYVTSPEGQEILERYGFSVPKVPSTKAMP